MNLSLNTLRVLAELGDEQGAAGYARWIGLIPYVKAYGHNEYRIEAFTVGTNIAVGSLIIPSKDLPDKNKELCPRCQRPNRFKMPFSYWADIGLCECKA